MELGEKANEGDTGVTTRFYHLLDELEEHLDKGFFLSFIGKIVVDEKKIYSLLNELRALTPEAVRSGALRGSSVQAEARAPERAAPSRADVPMSVEEEAARIRMGADKYASDVLKELEGHLQSISDVIQRGRDVLKNRMNDQEVK